MCVCVCVSFAEEPWKNNGFPPQKEPDKHMRNEGGRKQDSSRVKDVSGSVCVCVCRRETEKREKCASNRRMELVIRRHGCFIGLTLSLCHPHDSLYDSVTHSKTRMCHRGVYIYKYTSMYTSTISATVIGVALNFCHPHDSLYDSVTHQDTDVS